MSLRPDELRLDWCSTAAARYALTHWYARPEMPMGKRACIGVWERGDFRGVLMFGPGTVWSFGHAYGVPRGEGTQLTRLCLHPAHQSDLSRVLSIACRMVRQAYPKLRLIVTFAESDRYSGSVYQAAGWLYLGTTSASRTYMVNGRHYHGRAFRHAFGPGHDHDAGVRIIKDVPKHRYVLPLDDETRERLLPLTKPYPKRASSIDSDVPADLAGKGGASPTDALQPTAAG